GGKNRRGARSEQFRAAGAFPFGQRVKLSDQLVFKLDEDFFASHEHMLSHMVPEIVAKVATPRARSLGRARASEPPAGPCCFGGGQGPRENTSGSGGHSPEAAHRPRPASRRALHPCLD